MPDDHDDHGACAFSSPYSPPPANAIVSGVPLEVRINGSCGAGVLALDSVLRRF